jgi:hypothetical protein
MREKAEIESFSNLKDILTRNRTVLGNDKIKRQYNLAIKKEPSIEGKGDFEAAGIKLQLEQ